MQYKRSKSSILDLAAGKTGEVKQIVHLLGLLYAALSFVGTTSRLAVIYSAVGVDCTGLKPCGCPSANAKSVNEAE